MEEGWGGGGGGRKGRVLQDGLQISENTVPIKMLVEKSSSVNKTCHKHVILTSWVRVPHLNFGRNPFLDPSLSSHVDTIYIILFAPLLIPSFLPLLPHISSKLPTSLPQPCISKTYFPSGLALLLRPSCALAQSVGAGPFVSHPFSLLTSPTLVYFLLFPKKSTQCFSASWTFCFAFLFSCSLMIFISLLEYLHHNPALAVYYTILGLGEMEGRGVRTNRQSQGRPKASTSPPRPSYPASCLYQSSQSQSRVRRLRQRRNDNSHLDHNVSFHLKHHISSHWSLTIAASLDLFHRMPWDLRPCSLLVHSEEAGLVQYVELAGLNKGDVQSSSWSHQLSSNSVSPNPRQDSSSSRNSLVRWKRSGRR